MANVNIKFNGKDFLLSCDDGQEEHLEELANHLGNKFEKLKSDLGNIQLEYDYLSSAEKLLEYQSLYFEDQLFQKKIEDIKIYNISENLNKIEDYKITKKK